MREGSRGPDVPGGQCGDAGMAGASFSVLLGELVMLSGSLLAGNVLHTLHRSAHTLYHLTPLTPPCTPHTALHAPHTAL